MLLMPRHAGYLLLLLLLAPSVWAAHRVISLAPHTTELAYAAGMGSVLVAASAWSDYPPEAKSSSRSPPGKASILSGFLR